MSQDSKFMRCKSEHFVHLRVIIDNNDKEGEIPEIVTHRIKVGWRKCKGASGVLCELRICINLEGILYRSMRSAY